MSGGHRYNLRKRPGAAAAAASPSGGGGAAPASAAPDSPPPSSPPPAKAKEAESYESGTNWVHGGGIEANPYLFVLIVVSPFLSLLLAHVTSAEFAASAPESGWRVTHPLTEAAPYCLSNLGSCARGVLEAGLSVRPSRDGASLVLAFMAAALVLERSLPGKIETGPETATGHVPRYVDNGVKHCFAFAALFLLGSDLGPCGEAGERMLSLPSSIEGTICGVYQPYSFGILYDRFPSTLAFLNLFGIVFCMFLTYKGLYHPSTQDNGSSGSWVKDYLWGTELYPRVFGLDLKRFVNCRFSMTFWQLAGWSFCYRSYRLHGELDWGLFFAALSQYLYLVKFFFWEMGYMRSIDIIVDRAGYEIQWGCLVWVPAVYTFHSRFCVQNPSGLTFPAALALFVLGITGLGLLRDMFCTTKGSC
ncbi:hypothetical protein ACHAWF_018255 [Thalassiosira exigua]